MKRTLTVLTMLLISVTIFASKIVTKDIKQLPTQSQNFITTYFVNLNVQKIEIEKNLLGIKDYEVTFTNGYEIEFDKKGEWTKVDCKRNPIPGALVPQKIKDHIKIEFKGDHITEIKKKKGGFEVELQNDITLIFNSKGEFKKYD